MNQPASSDHACQICRAPALEEIAEFRELARVTSDSRPWPAGGRLAVCKECGAIQKLPDAIWCDEIDRIYNRYEIYHQAAGAEQQVYETGKTEATPRSRKLIVALAEQLKLPETGRLLDFGCGNGAALRNFAAVRPGWDLSGSEITDRALPELRTIPRFTKLYTCPVDQIPERFTLVTLIHSLEHVLDPVEMMVRLRDRIEESGHLFVQVPDAGRSPFDLVVTDHLLHFTRSSLQEVADRAKYATELLSNSLVDKELSFIGSPAVRTRSGAAQSGSNSEPARAMTLVRRHLAILKAQISASRKLANQSPRFGVFGTSIAGTWLSGILADRVAFFVDEDPNRINRTHMGRPIYAPSDVPDDSDIFVALVPDIASRVAQRLSRKACRFHAPPDLPGEF